LVGCVGGRDSTVPRLTGDEFRRLSAELSEPGGAFHTDNLVSNELSYAHTLRRLGPAGGAYIGVGPEQNFSYIATLEPAMAFIVDIRAENRTLHLVYKALFEAASDRTGFLSRLLSREPPPGLIRDVSVNELMTAFQAARPSEALLDATTRVVIGALRSHGWPLETAEAEEVARILRAFFEDGPSIHYDRAKPPANQRPSFAALMTAADHMGVTRSFLASESRFAFVKDLHARHLIVPVVGDFGTGRAIERVGAELRRRGIVVTAFYASNVEVYLTNQEMIPYCGSVRALPQADGAWFIDSKGAESLAVKLAACPPDRRPFAGSQRAPAKSP
jgi:hypothetical protein